MPGIVWSIRVYKLNGTNRAVWIDRVCMPCIVLIIREYKSNNLNRAVWIDGGIHDRHSRNY